MSRFMLSAIASVAMVALAGAPAQADEKKPADTEMTKGEKRLAKLIDGRIAGKSDQCIRDHPSHGFEVIDKTAIVYRVGRTVWVNYTRDPESLDDDDVLIIRRYGTQLCSTDIVTTVDRISGFYTGNVFLAEFVPYRLPEKEG